MGWSQLELMMFLSAWVAFCMLPLSGFLFRHHNLLRLIKYNFYRFFLIDLDGNEFRLINFIIICSGLMFGNNSLSDFI